MIVLSFVVVASLWLEISTAQIVEPVFDLRKIETFTSPIDGSGMDGASFKFLSYSNGGSYSVEICKPEQCCSTGILNTDDNNWEEGQTDWFVGRQIRDCSGFQLREGDDIELRLFHKGSNAGLLEYIKLHSWHTAGSWVCPINTRLDYSSSHQTSCRYQENHSHQDQTLWCNGRPEFCSLGFDQFLFPGTHNAGTGQGEGTWQCSSKNQDLNITEQLDFGIRFLDIDSIYSTTVANCHGLEAGHGAAPEFGIYQCYGQISDVLSELKNWLNNHTSEIVVLYFGGIAEKSETVSRLIDAVENAFDGTEGVRMNTEFKESGLWPTLGEAKEQNARLFTFIRDEGMGRDTQGLVSEVKVKPDESPEQVLPGQVVIVSSYRARWVGSDCGFVQDAAEESCSRQDVDFVKLALFSRFGKGGAIGTDCLYDMARVCNQWVEPIIQLCANSNANVTRFQPNVILLDYPNYQATDREGFIKHCETENIRRATSILLQ